MAKVNIEATKYYKSGVANLAAGKYEQALEDLKLANAYSPTSEVVLAQLIIAARHNCDWLTAKKHDSLITLASKTIEEAGIPGITPYYVNTLTDNPRLQKIIAQIWTNELKDGQIDHRQLTKNITKNTQETGSFFGRKKIKIGYLSNNFNNHAVAHVAVDLFKHHDKNKFEVFGFSYSKPDSSSFHTKLKKSFDNFFDISKMTNHEAIAVIQGQQLDILIDMVGYMSGCRPQIVSARPAPILVNFLGLTGTTGGLADYIIVDKNLIPRKLEGYYTEKVIRLPYYQPNSPRPKVAKTAIRANHNLPEKKFIFASFNRSYKITPEVWKTWMNILKRVPSSALWTWADSGLAQKNLQQNTLLEGVDPTRIIFAPTMDFTRHIARLALADIALDTYPYNGGATTSNFLWAGVPVVSVYGATYTSRMGKSLLSAVGLKRLAVDNLQKYEDLAVKLANSKKLPVKKGKLFNIKFFVKCLENGYQKIYNRSNK